MRTRSPVPPRPTSVRLPGPSQPAVAVTWAAVEIAPLGLDLSLASSSETIGVGTGTVPVGNISPAALLPTPSTGSDSFLRFSTIRHSTIRHSTIRHSTIRHSAIDYSTIRHSTIRHSDAEAALRSAGIADPLETIALSDLTLDRPGGWDALLLGTQWENTPRESITLADVMPLIESAGVTLDQLDLSDTSLGSVPYVSLLLGGVPMEKIPLSPALENGTDQQRLAAWCSAVRTGAVDPCAALDVDPAAATPSSITPLALSYAGYSLDGVSLNQILRQERRRERRRLVPVDEPRPLRTGDYLPLDAAGEFASERLGRLHQGCVSNREPRPGCADPGRDRPARTLYDLFTNAATVVLPKVAVFTIGDLLQGIIPPDEMPWQGLDLEATSLQNVANPTEPVLTYTMSLDVKGDRPAATSVQFTLPPSFVLVPGTFKIDGVTATDPTVGSGNIASLALGTLAPGAHTATLGSRAGLTLGPATATAAGTATAGTNTATASSSKTVTVLESFEQGGTGLCGDLDACDTKTLQPDTLYLAHISNQSDRDLYRFTVPATRARSRRASILLSNLPADYDLVLYGLRRTPARTRRPNRFNRSTTRRSASTRRTSTLAPDTVKDVPLTPPAYAPGVIQVSANRGTVDEQIDTGTLAPGDYAAAGLGLQRRVQSRAVLAADVAHRFTTPLDLRSTGGPPVRRRRRRLADVLHAWARTRTCCSSYPSTGCTSTYGAARVDPLITKVQSLADLGRRDDPRGRQRRAPPPPRSTPRGTRNRCSPTPPTMWCARSARRSTPPARPTRRSTAS